MKITGAPRVIGYVRVSTDDQAISPEVQRQGIMAKAIELGCECIFFEDIGVSGSKGIEDREGLLCGINALQRGDYFVVAKLDRLARDLMTQLVIDSMIKKSRCRLVSCQGEGTSLENDPQARFMMQILGAVSELERAMVQQRTIAALALKRARGEKTGGCAPYGYDVDSGGRLLIPNSAERGVINLVLQRRREAVTFRAIMAELNGLNVPTKQGKRWNIRQIQLIIERHSG